MINIYIIQHLLVENNIRGIVTGLTNQPVLQTGRCLANLINVIKTIKFDFIICSTLLRSIQTIQLCFSNEHIELIKDNRFLPVDYGSFHSKKKIDVAKVNYQYVTKPFPNGESFNDMALRHHQALKELNNKYEGSNFLLVGHEGTQVILRYLCEGFPLEKGFRESGQSIVKQNLTKLNHESSFSQPPKGPFKYA